MKAKKEAQKEDKKEEIPEMKAEPLNEIKQKSEENSEDRQKKDNKDGKIKELTETLQRLQADFENYKKRVERDSIIIREYAEMDFVRNLLPVLDSFELAIRNNNCDLEKLRKGMEIIYSQFYSVLSQAGLRPIDALGDKFDAYRHEVLMMVPSEKEGIILEEFQKGYTFKDAVIRHSKVKVGKKEDKNNKKEDKGEKC